MTQPVWRPTQDRIQNANLTQFIKQVSQKTGKKFSSYHELYHWSIQNLEEFWQSIWEFSEIVHSKKYEKILDADGMWRAKWFQGAKLNFAENLLRYRDDRTAIISWTEYREPVRYTFQELYLLVAKFAESLKQNGVKQGDRVVGYISNIPEAIIAMLAATSIGAVWSSCSPDFGIQGVLDRFGQIQPKILITANGYSYNGKKFNLVHRVEQIAEKIPSLDKIVIIQQIVGDNGKSIPKSIDWHEFISNSATEIEFNQLPFDHPVYIMYSSGTTGVPKCIVHGAGGTLLQHYKELMLHTNLKREDTFLYFTTCGWMMWNWLVSSLAVGSTVFLYEGNPAYPDIGILWKAIMDEKINVFGTSPKFLTTCENAGIQPGQKYDLSSLKTLLSTGSPLTNRNFEWVYKNVKQDVQLSSISGGTDIISCFMLGNPLLPVYSGEIQCLGLGMKVETTDEGGQIIKNQVGELVCTAPFPSRPIYFWNDPDNQKYRSAYYDHFPGIWRHGDYIKITENEGVIVFGRSDSTLNPGGVRIGTAEIYGPVEVMAEIEDCVVVGQKWQDDVRIVLFVVLAATVKFDEELIQKIKSTIRQNRTPRHVPSIILPIKDVPRTISGKKVELAVTKTIHGEEVKNKSALANPESLEQFEYIPELLS